MGAIILHMTWRFLVPFFLALPLLGQQFGGIDVRLGMAKDPLLAKLAANSSVKINELDSSHDWYMVLVKQLDDTWGSAGDITFQAGKVDRIVVSEHSTNNEKEAGRTVKAAYTAIVNGGDVMSVSTRTNNDANTPLYEIHLIFKDREVVISATSLRNGIETASVDTYFPRVLKRDRK
jgi:hypothetical protein